jgi:hypothetical protein
MVGGGGTKNVGYDRKNPAGGYSSPCLVYSKREKFISAQYCNLQILALKGPAEFSTTTQSNLWAGSADFAGDRQVSLANTVSLGYTHFLFTKVLKEISYIVVGMFWSLLFKFKKKCQHSIIGFSSGKNG